ncbi:MAG: S8 family serine peptidase [Chloroflexota bacterium]|nr:S8 family serine peptidase [Chloroflexota bacterium]
MRKSREKLLLVGVLLLLNLIALPVAAEPVVEPELWRALAAVDETPLRVIVVFYAAQPTAPFQAAAEFAGEPLQAREVLVAGLQEQLTRAKLDVEPLLAAAEARGELLARRELWIINGLALTARPALVQELARSETVAELRLDQTRPYVEIAPSGTVTDVNRVPWGIERLRAPALWQTLAISGTGAVVASVDTGVDWLHPDLQANYRGQLGHGLVEHAGAWFDAVNGGQYPYDDYGHGTHTLGTAAGGAGIGVAPGARWLGVKVLNRAGNGYDADIHAGFQWLLAPGGDPALAPDVVICSWGARNPSSEEFRPDIAALEAAGIFPIFAAGNEGPRPETLRAPASLPGIFAVGASDLYEQVATFSSRGPSPWGEVKPYVVAPGVATRSAAPGGTYATYQGTSMATPHVAGIAALLRGVSRTLPIHTMARIITETAIPLTTTVPHQASGWGRVDAYDALVALTQPAVVTGTVQGAEAGLLTGATVHAAPHGAGSPALAKTDAAGVYRLALRPGQYDFTASAFGHGMESEWGVRVITGSVHRVDFLLPALPTGELRGQATVINTQKIPTRTVTMQVCGTPVTTTLDGAGRYTLALPAGEYTVEARGNGYRVVTATVSITAGETTEQDFALPLAPTLLLVDEGGWYYGSQTVYWRAALDALRYEYAEYVITKPPVDAAFAAQLVTYDAVLWSSPYGSPGLVRAGEVLTDYLTAGGKLLLSGQDVGYFDSGSSMGMVPQDYLREQVSVQLVADSEETRELVGAGPFAGLHVEIAGGDGADNQISPDGVAVRNPDVAELFWRYAGGNGGGVGAHLCRPYRALFFSFGYEAIAGAGTRREVLARALDWLVLPQPTSGLTLTYQAGPRVGLPGKTVTHTFRVRHIGIAGPPDTVVVELAGNRWPTTVTPTTVTLAPCTSQYFTVSVNIPPEAALNESDYVTLAVHSSLVAEPLTRTLVSKSPAPVLLVDDDRWYPMVERYTAALDAAGIPYDHWDTTAGAGPNTGEVLTNTLTAHPLTIWFTGYDWYAPVTAAEEARLLHYLDDGGKLWLTSQDFLPYTEENRPLGERLGVRERIYDRSTETAYAVRAESASGSWGPVTLEVPFQNWSDAVEPVRDASIVVRGDGGQPVALARSGAPTATWRTLFYAFPLEMLPLAERTAALKAGVGWLSPLGESSWSVTPSAPLPGEHVTATVVLRNTGPVARAAAFSHTVPLSLTLLAGTLPPAVNYTPSARLVEWSGELGVNAPLTFSWQAQVAGTAPAGLALTPAITLCWPAWQLAFERAEMLRVAGPDLSGSAWAEMGGSGLAIKEPATVTFTLQNSGPGAVSDGELRFWLTPGLAPITATLPPTRGLGLAWWAGALAPGATRTFELPVQAWWGGVTLRLDALWEDGTGRRGEQSLWLHVALEKLYLPVVCRGSE